MAFYYVSIYLRDGVQRVNDEEKRHLEEKYSGFMSTKPKFFKSKKDAVRYKLQELGEDVAHRDMQMKASQKRKERFVKKHKAILAESA